MKKVYIYRLVDETGDVLDEVAVNEPSDNICLGGYDKYGDYHQFDSYKAHRANAYFEGLNCGLHVVGASVEIDTNALDFIR